MPAGYLHPDYVASLSESGMPLQLPGCGGWLLKREIPGTALSDAMGCYPLFCCSDWQSLPNDIETLCNDLVSLVLVTDPVSESEQGLLKTCFDNVTPFKQHFVVETGAPLSSFVRASHRKHAMRVLKEVDVEICPEPLDYLDDWERLFGVLRERHGIKGIRSFSRAAFAKQLAIPGMVMFRAVVGQETVGLDLWYVQGDCAQGHLAAFDSAGYKLRVSYATKWRVLEYFSDKVKWINLGAGLSQNNDDGLSDFKRGWSTGTKTTFLCSRVLQSELYAELANAGGNTNNGYFPAYRKNEFE